MSILKFTGKVIKKPFRGNVDDIMTGDKLRDLDKILDLLKQEAEFWNATKDFHGYDFLKENDCWWKGKELK